MFQGIGGLKATKLPITLQKQEPTNNTKLMLSSLLFKLHYILFSERKAVTTENDLVLTIHCKDYSLLTIILCTIKFFYIYILLFFPIKTLKYLDLACMLLMFQILQVRLVSINNNLDIKGNKLFQ